ncbi:MAG: glycoside hydrolase family 5 protein [Verrucomicrobiota bacterium]
MDVTLKVTEKDLADLAAMRATGVRLVFYDQPLVRKTPPYGYDEEAFQQLDRIVDCCERLGLKVIVDPHTMPGIASPFTGEFADAFWREDQWHDRLIDLWRRLANRLKSRGAVIAGYDLLNEPCTPRDAKPGGPGDWNHLVARLVATIRATGDGHPIIIETAVGFEPNGAFVNRLDAITRLRLPKDPNLVVSPHMYEPHDFTHQGIKERPIGVRYPGVAEGMRWDRSQLEQAFKRVREFQAEYQVPILIGEFSASRFAGEDGNRYLADLLDIFERDGWSWVYHDFRSSAVWDPEMSVVLPASQMRDPDAPRMKLLRNYFATQIPGRSNIPSPNITQ